MQEEGWRPVSNTKHVKFERVLPLSGRRQVVTLPTTPSDAQRGTRNTVGAWRRPRAPRAASARPAGGARTCVHLCTHAMHTRTDLCAHILYKCTHTCAPMHTHFCLGIHTEALQPPPPRPQPTCGGWTARRAASRRRRRARGSRRPASRARAPPGWGSPETPTPLEPPALTLLLERRAASPWVLCPPLASRLACACTVALLPGACACDCTEQNTRGAPLARH